MAKPGVMFYFDVRPCIRRLTLAEKGRLFEAILDYAELGVVPEVDGSLGVAWDFIQPKIDRDAERYEQQVAQKQFAVFSREIKKRGGIPIPFEDWKSLSDNERDRLLSGDNERYPTSTSNPNVQLQTSSSALKESSSADKPPRSPHFKPPTVEEVAAYCQERGNRVDPRQFCDFYASKNWLVGKVKMSDWKACVRTWERRDNKEKGAATIPPDVPDNMQQVTDQNGRTRWIRKK